MLNGNYNKSTCVLFLALVMLLHLPLWVLIVATLPSSILGNGVYGIMTQVIKSECISLSCYYRRIYFDAKMPVTLTKNLAESNALSLCKWDLQAMNCFTFDKRKYNREVTSVLL